MTIKDLLDYVAYLRVKTGQPVNLMNITDKQIDKFKSERVHKSE